MKRILAISTLLVLVMMSVELLQIDARTLFAQSGYESIDDLPPGGLGAEPSPAGKYPSFEGQTLLEGNTLLSVQNMPSSVDLSDDLPPIGNQGQTGSCTAWAVSYYYKTFQQRQEHNYSLVDDLGNSIDSRIFSPSFVYNQLLGGTTSCTDGVGVGAALALIAGDGTFLPSNIHGDLPLSEFPWNPNNCSMLPEDGQRDLAINYSAEGYQSLILNPSIRWDVGNGPTSPPYSNDLTLVKESLASGNPVVLVVPVYREFDVAWCDDSVSPPHDYNSFRGLHAVLAVGYDDQFATTGAIRIVNSWGPERGCGGFANLSYEFLEQFMLEAWIMIDRPDGPVPAPPADDQAILVRDVTIPDGFVASPGQSLSKTWRMRNLGTTTWGSGYQLVFVGGEQMGAPGAVSVSTVAPGQEANISVNLSAPAATGDHVGYWQLRNPQGTYFGPKIWVKIDVKSSSSHISSLTADPPSPADTANVTFRAAAYDFDNLRAMRLKIDGNVIYELGGPEITFNWSTAGYSPGDHSVVVEATDWGDLNWARPEQRSMIYHLNGNAGADNRKPNRPDPASPHDWYMYYSGNTAQLCAWNNGDPDQGDSITGYYFDIYESARLWNSGWTSSSCVTTSALDPYNYKWRVKVRDNHGKESDWSDSWHFTLANPNLSITQMYFEPLDSDSEVIKIRACTAGQGGVGITMRVLVNDANNGSSNGNWKIIHELGVPCYNDIDAPTWRTLNYETGTYRFRVEAHGSSTSWDGAAAREETFTVPHRRPSDIELLSPRPASRDMDEAIFLNSRTVTFHWKQPLRANSLVLSISDQPSPKDDPTPIYRQTLSPSVTEHTVTFDQDYPTLYWQVGAINDKGSNASGDQLFGLDLTQPSCTVESLPGTEYENVFQVKWLAADGLSGVKTADIQVMDQSEDSGQWLDWLTSVPSTQSYELFTGKPGHRYEFRCRAADNAGNQNAYPETADTTTLLDPTARPTSPWWDQSYANKRQITILNNMPLDTLPAAYPVNLHFDNTTTPTAAEIYADSQSNPKCDDVRMVYDDTSEVDRVIDSCSSTEIDIWFRVQDSVQGGSADNTSHQLYYGNSAPGSPAADPNRVWYPYREADTTYLYYLNEGSGNTAYDSSGNGRNCSIDQSVQWDTSKFGTGLRFNRANSGDSHSLNCGSALPLSAFTVEFWYKPEVGDSGRIAGELGGGGGSNWLIQNAEGKIRFDVWPCSTCGSSEVRSDFNLNQSPFVGRWNHVAVTFNGANQVKFYLNGQLDSTKSLSQSGINMFTPQLEIGSVGGIGQIKAGLGAFRISSGVKSSFPYGSFAAIISEPDVAVGDLIEPPIAGTPDLVIVDLTTLPMLASEDWKGSQTMAVVTIMNQGDRRTSNGFFTELYTLGVNDTRFSEAVWVSESLEPGATAELTMGLPIFVQDLLPFSRTSSSDHDEATFTLYAEVDYTDVVNEPDEINNVTAEGVEYCQPEMESFALDDRREIAQTIALGEIQQRTFEYLEDEDWVKFAAEAGEAYLLRTFDLGVSADTYLYLYDTDGATLLAANDDEGDTLASRIIWIAPYDGTYYAVVKHWNPNASGCGNSYKLELTDAMVTHGLEFLTGWNMVSTNVSPQTPQMDGIFPLPDRDKLVLCKDGDGNTYWPEYGINTIGSWNPSRAYQCYTRQGFELPIRGLPLDPSEPMELPAGWNMIAYWQDTAMPVEQAFSSLGSNLVIAKTGDGKIYWPEYGINSIGDMQPGQGYKLYLSTPATLVYPAD